MINFAVDEPRRHLVENYIARGWGEPLRDRIRQFTYTELFRAGELEPGTWIFTGIDALSPAELRMVDVLESAARRAGFPVLNSALRFLNRYDLLRTLYDGGLNEFRAYRADESLDRLRFPVFLRVAQEHDGSLTPLLHDRRELARAMLYVRMRGLPREQVLVVEFCDTSGPDRLYRKYSLFRIKQRLIPRYLHISQHWMAKEGTRELEEKLLDEQMSFLLDNPHEQWARAVFEKANIDYGRLDYGLRDGRPQVWEINVTPTLAGVPRQQSGGPGDVHHPLYPARSHAHKAMREAFEEIDTSAGSPARFEFPTQLIEEAQDERRALDAILKRRRLISKFAAAPLLKNAGAFLRRRNLPPEPHVK